MDVLLFIFEPLPRFGHSVHSARVPGDLLGALFPRIQVPRAGQRRPAGDLNPSPGGTLGSGQQGAPARGWARVPSTAPRRARQPWPPCARCCRSCAPAGAGARRPPLPPSCPGEGVQGLGRTAPWPSTAPRSAASRTPPVTASSSVSSSRGPRRAAHRGRSRWGLCGPRGLLPPPFGFAVVAEQPRGPRRATGAAGEGAAD